MSEHSARQSKDESGKGDNLNELVMDLNFEPEWARRPPPKGDTWDEPRHREPRGRRGRGDRGDNRQRGDHRNSRADGGSRRRPQAGGRGAPDRRAAKGADRGRRDSHDRGRQPRRSQAHEYVELPPVEVSILPSQQGLSTLARRIHSSRRAYPLLEIASIFMENPDACLIRIQVERKAGDVSLFQCKTCRSVAVEHSTAVEHVVGAHMDEYVEKEETSTDPPAGSFVCVCRCGYTGVLLGPPNHHSYNARLRETHHLKCAHVPFETYSSRVETLRDPELIEKWKEESSKQTVYRFKSDGADQALSYLEAEEKFRREIAPSLITRTRRAVIPAKIGRKLEDKGMALAVRRKWEREQRFPLSFSFALHSAFRHMHLHPFRTGGGMRFVSSVAPTPLDPEHAVDTIREILLHLRDHPGCTRRELAEALAPGEGKESDAVQRILRPLDWLIEKGHILEFFDGKLSVPMKKM